MRNNKTNLLLAALAGLIAQPEGPRPSGIFQTRADPAPKRRYPEQSSRQAMRGHRRARGGPGIELNRRTHEYQPRYF